jgi:lysophospholipase
VGVTVAEIRNFHINKDAKCNLLNKAISDVLVICTGGTFCMVKTDKGYMALKGLIHRLKKYQVFYDEEYAKSNNMSPEILITPETPYGKRIRFEVLEFEELIDSSNMVIADWIKIAKTIEINYKKYDGFIVLHGTDTMAYTASALSFMLENLNKTVVVTGSQIPILELKNDAVDNLLGSLLVAGHYNIPEVAIFFNNKLLRGNRATKENTIEMEAFGSPNLAPLGTMGVNFEINWEAIQRHTFEGKMEAFTNMSSDISLISISPCLNMKVIDSVLMNSEGKGLYYKLIHNFSHYH